MLAKIQDLFLEIDHTLVNQNTLNLKPLAQRYEITEKALLAAVVLYIEQVQSATGIGLTISDEQLLVAPEVFAGGINVTQFNKHNDVFKQSHIQRIDDLKQTIQQAIEECNAISIIYTSLNQGSASREVVPHSVIDTGNRLHMRGFDRKANQFRDFVIGRISHVRHCKGAVHSYELVEADNDWNRLLEIKLVPHPNNAHQPIALAMEFDMQDGVKSIQVRSALVGYLLRQWNVDCSKHHSLRGEHYQLWLANRDSLFAAENLILAPGFTVA